MAVISFGDGRLIEHMEGALRVPPPPPAVKKPQKPPKKYPDRRKGVVIRGMRFKFDPRGPRYERGALPPNPSLDIPGYHEWRTMRSAQIRDATPQARRLGRANGMSQRQSDAKWAIARKRARKDMEKIKQLFDVDAAGEEALESTLAVMRSPMDQKTRLAAAKQILEYCRIKPIAKSEVTINAAEKWLAELGQDGE